MIDFVKRTGRGSEKPEEAKYPSSELIQHVGKFSPDMIRALTQAIRLEARLEGLVGKKLGGGQSLDDMEQIGIVMQELIEQYRLALGKGEPAALQGMATDMAAAAMATAKERVPGKSA
jgi:hypothetical protein